MKEDKMKIENEKEIEGRKKEIEEEIKDMLVECESDFDLDYIKMVVFEEEESDDMMKIVAAFDRGGDVSELENVLELATDAWNYFPHKSLKGKSPAEVVLKHQKNSKKLNNLSQGGKRFGKIKR